MLYAPRDNVIINFPSLPYRKIATFYNDSFIPQFHNSIFSFFNSFIRFINFSILNILPIYDKKNIRLWFLVKDYLFYLGEDTINSLGYNFIELENKIESCHHKHKLYKFKVLSLFYYLESQENLKIYERLLISFKRSIYFRGIRNTFRIIFRKIIYLFNL